MGNWIFMFIMDLLIPLTMAGFGGAFLKTAPGEINGIFGYRTSMSMKNKDTWVFAHNHCGRIWFVCGLVLLAVSIIVMLLVMGKAENVVGTVGFVLCMIQLAVLIGSIFPTEKALKKTFDNNGNRR